MNNDSVKTRRAIFWATLAIVNTINGITITGEARYWLAAAILFCLLMILAQTFTSKKQDATGVSDD